MRFLRALTIAGLAASAPVSGMAQTHIVADPFGAFVRGMPEADYSIFDFPIYRVTRDFNNDGRIDVAFTFTIECGAGSFSSGCAYEIFLLRADGRYLDVGGPDWGHAATAAIEPIRSGVARLSPCNVDPDGAQWISPWRVSTTGVTAEADIPVADPEHDSRCYPLRNGAQDFVLEQCSSRAYLSAHECVWRPLD